MATATAALAAAATAPATDSKAAIKPLCRHHTQRHAACDADSASVENFTLGGLGILCYARFAAAWDRTFSSNHSSGLATMVAAAAYLFCIRHSSIGTLRG